MGKLHIRAPTQCLAKENKYDIQSILLIDLILQIFSTGKEGKKTKVFYSLVREVSLLVCFICKTANSQNLEKGKMHSKTQSEECAKEARWVSQGTDIFSITKLIPGHCLKTKKNNTELYIEKIKNFLLNPCRHPHVCHSTSLSRANYYIQFLYTLLEPFLYIIYKNIYTLLEPSRTFSMYLYITS